MDLDDVHSSGYSFQIEMTHRAQHSGATIREVPIVFRERSAGASKMSTAIVGEALLMVPRLAARDRRRAAPAPPIAVGGAQ